MFDMAIHPGAVSLLFLGGAVAAVPTSPFRLSRQPAIARNPAQYGEEPEGTTPGRESQLGRAWLPMHSQGNNREGMGGRRYTTATGTHQRIRDLSACMSIRSHHVISRNQIHLYRHAHENTYNAKFNELAPESMHIVEYFDAREGK